MSLVPIKKNTTLKDQAYQAIKQAIYSNELEPGSPLVEEQLSASLSISRTPIRSALQQLVYEKLATTDSTGHIYVSRITPKDVTDITVIRQNLEPLAIDLAAFPVDPAIIEKLNQLIQAQSSLTMQNTLHNIQYAELDCEFHATLASISGNELLTETIRSINALMIRILILSGTLDSNKSKASEEHSLIIRHLADGQRQLAKAALIQHLENVSSRML